MRFLTAGSRAVLVELGGIEEVGALHENLRRRPPAGTVELVPAARTILVVFDPTLTTRDRLVAHVSRAAEHVKHVGDVGEAEHEHDAAKSQEVRIPVVYDGPDLGEVADRTGLRVAEVIERHAASLYTVAFCGFAPGFAYLAGVDPLLRLPRREAPRTHVPAGSVAVSDQFTSVYPHASPGGWHLLGRTAAVMWDVGRQPPGLLLPGDRVRFVPASI